MVMIYLGTSLVYRYLDSLNINDLPRPTETFLDQNPAKYAEHMLLPWTPIFTET